jgi:cytoskeletal protein CcmA (bactofilin family)
MRQRRIRSGALLIIGLLLIAGAVQVNAADSRQGDECIVAVDEVIESDMYVACNTLTIEGTIEGDLIGGAWAATIAPEGRINGDIWLIGGQLRVEGAVDDDVRFAGVDLDITENAELQTRSDVTAVALNVEIWEGAVLPGDLIVLGYQVIVRGNIDGDIDFNGSALVIDGNINGNIEARVSGGETSPSFIPFPFPFSISFQTPGLTVLSNGRIGGDLIYSGPRPGNINGRIGGEIDFRLSTPRPDITQAALETEEARPGDLIVRYLNTVLTDVLSLMAAGIIVMVVAPAWLREPSKLIPRQIPSSFGWGMILALMAIPFSLIIVLVCIVFLVFLSLITLGGFTWMGLLLLLTVNTLVIGGFAFVILFMARLVISEVLGRRVGRRMLHTSDTLAINLLSLLMGTVIYSLITNIPLPWVGLILNAIGVFIGLGAIALHARQLYQRTIRVVYPAPSSASPTVPVSTPVKTAPALEALLGNAPEPPPDSTEPPQPGLANLPDGFSWWGAGGNEETN